MTLPRTQRPESPTPNRRRLTAAVARAGALLALILPLTLLLPGALAAQPCADIDSASCPAPLDWESPRGLGLASGGRANAASTAALMYNPAALVLGGAYHIEGLGDYRTDNGTVALGAGISDSATSRLAGGFAIRGFLSGRDGYKGLDMRAALALPLSDIASLGVAGRYLSVDQEVTRDDGSTADAEIANGITLDAAFRFQPSELLHLAVLAQNLVDLDSALLPIMVGGAVALTPLQELAITGDVMVDLSSFDGPAVVLGAGAEYLAARAFPLRLGYRVDAERSLHQLGIGIGYTTQEMGIDLGFRQDLSGGNATRVLLGIRYHLQ